MRCTSITKKDNNQIFHKLKSIAEVERMTPDERLEYELSLSVERDLYACIVTQFEMGVASNIITDSLGLSPAEIENL